MRACVCLQQIVECLVSQDDVNRDMQARRAAVKQRYMRLQLQLDQLHQRSEQIRLDGLSDVQLSVFQFIVFI